MFLTKRYIAVPHPRRNPNLIVRCEAGHLVAREKIPHNCGAPSIVAHHQTTGPTLADSISGDPRNILAMPGESSFDGQSVVMKAQNDIALSVEQEGCCRSAWFKGEFVAPWGNAGCWGLVLDV